MALPLCGFLLKLLGKVGDACLGFHFGVDVGEGVVSVEADAGRVDERVVKHGAELVVRAEDVRVDGTPPLYLHTSAYVSMREAYKSPTRT